MRRNSITLSRRHEWFAYLVSFAVFGTGAVWAFLHFLALPPNDFGSASPAESWVLKAHGAAAMATLLLVGTLLPMHVKFAWRARRNLRSGLTLLGIFGFLILTGYGLYYAGGEELRAWTSQAHLWVGLALPLFLGGHVWWGKRTRRK
ncbi:MAG TPA: hypothetical protein VK474_06215 [Chthoniobacterales bacterium]|nr:hypothetical protein [Chthoniobacterales bacterium]